MTIGNWTFGWCMVKKEKMNYYIFNFFLKIIVAVINYRYVQNENCQKFKIKLVTLIGLEGNAMDFENNKT